MKELHRHITSAGPSLEIPPLQEFLNPALQFILAYAAQLGMEEERREKLRKAAEVAIALVMRNSLEEDPPKAVGLEVLEANGSLVIEILNRGVPLFMNSKGAAQETFQDVSRLLDQVAIENLGRQGQTFVLGMRLGTEAAKRSIAKQSFQHDEEISSEAEIEIREIRLGEENLLSQLFYFVYGYQYINEFVYYPEKIRALLDEKKLISLVAVLPSGKLVGHVGLLKWNDKPVVYEPCLGVVDPRLKSRGLFSAIFQRTMDLVKEIPMQYCFFDFVTNHDYSQRLVSRFGTVDLALFVGCQSKETQARLEKLGMGEDPKDMDRYSLLYGVIPRVQHPFGREVLLPNNLGELLGFLLKPLNLSWSPAPRFQLLQAQGAYQTQIQPTQSAVIFDLFDPGRVAVENILKEWQEFLRSGYQYAGIEVPLEAPGLGHLYDILCEHGFFIAGFVPYHFSNRLGIRFQSIGHTKVAFDKIKVSTDHGRRLLEIVKGNYERNQLL